MAAAALAQQAHELEASRRALEEVAATGLLSPHQAERLRSMLETILGTGPAPGE